jgi:hypothetical protein
MRRLSRLPFLLAVALIAAAIGDPLVETIANTGILGPGYLDNDHSSVVPALIAGAFVAALLIGWQCRQFLRRRRDFVERPLADMPYVYVLQLNALFVMESCEQFFAHGEFLGGTAWLGGPVWFSLIAHALIGAICTLLIARGVRAIVHRAATLVEIVIERILGAISRTTATMFARRDDDAQHCRMRVLHVRQCGERAPPSLLILT